MDLILQNVLAALSAAMNGQIIPPLDENDINEAEQQAVYSLICSKPQALPYISKNVQRMWEQDQLSKVLEGIPYLVIKGASAAIYYPDPMRRTLGDIDIIVAPQYFDNAYQALTAAGYVSKEPIDADIRHIHFRQNGILIELHRRFATLQTKAQERILDEWLYSATPSMGMLGKYSFPMPQKELNGLVLLTHINQHLEEGLGLRQLLDWIMYVRQSLPNESWESFKKKTDELGLTTLAKAVTRFGQIYLKINTELTWCQDVQDTTVEKLLDYVYECGNFGSKDSRNNTMIMVMSHGRGVKGFFRNLQNRGLKNWGAVSMYPWLAPFAWIYQLIRYVKKGVKNDGLFNLGDNLAASRRRNELLDELDAARTAFRTDSTARVAEQVDITKIDSRRGNNTQSNSILKRIGRPIYYRLKKSNVGRIFYYINDWYYICRHKLMGKATISESDVSNVEKNVTFIYKSFNRQHQARRLYKSIKEYYPQAHIIIADDSKEPLYIEGADIIHLPFNSGLCKGIIKALERVETEYVMRMDDDELLTPKSNIHVQLSYLQSHPMVDLVGVQPSFRNPEKAAAVYSGIKMRKQLVIPAGTIIDGREVVYKTPNIYLARTEKVREVGYDPNIRMIDHHEFFYRAAGQIVSVQDPHSYVMHCHNRFEKEYDLYRRDTLSDARYIRMKHGRQYG